MIERLSVTENSAPRSRRAFITVNPFVPDGEIRVGGTVILTRAASDEEIGFAATARPVSVHDENHAQSLERGLRAQGVECRRQEWAPSWRGRADDRG